MAVLAKLSRPRLQGACPRERLFARLDQCRRHAAVWISAPPGAGKTTLTAGYLDTRGLPALWYQVDAGDADPASFFYYLGLGARQGGFGHETDLPLLTPEYLPDLPGFARRYFRALFAGLPKDGVLVLDNYQELPEAAPLQGLIVAAVREVPEAANLMFLSRSEPPAHFAGLSASGALGEIGAEALLLTPEETRGIAMLDGPLDEAAVRALHERAQGWAAGVVLMAKRYRRLGAEGLRVNRHEATFDYFESEIIARADAQTRELLLHTAWMPRFTATMAEGLAGISKAERLLAALHRQHCFTSRSTGAAPPTNTTRCFASSFSIGHAPSSPTRSARGSSIARRRSWPRTNRKTMPFTSTATRRTWPLRCSSCFPRRRAWSATAAGRCWASGSRRCPPG